MSTEWRAQRERGHSLLVRTIGRIGLELGRGPARLLLYPICLYYLLFWPRALRGSRSYLRRVLGRPPKLRDVFRHYHAFASTVLDRVYFATGRTTGLHVQTQGAHLLDRLLAEGRGVSYSVRISAASKHCARRVRSTRASDQRPDAH